MTTQPDPRDAFFSRLKQGAGGDDSRQLGFESSVVRHLLRGLGKAPSSWRILEDEARAKYGTPELTFDWLAATYPHCPVIFGSEKIRKSHRVSIDDLYNRFTKTVIFKAYQQFLAGQDLRDSERQVAFVFNWASTKHVMVLHNMQQAIYGPADQGGTSIVHRRLNSDVVYTLEPLTKFIVRIKDEWIEFS